MMISPPSAGDRHAAAAALDRALRSSTDPSGDADGPPDASSGDASPDVVVTLSRSGAASPSTYDASGRMAGPPTLDELGANAPDSMAHASEAVAGDDDAAPAAEDANANADQDAAVAA